MDSNSVLSRLLPDPALENIYIYIYFRVLQEGIAVFPYGDAPPPLPLWFPYA